MRPKIPIRPIRIEGALAYISLSQGLEAVIDAADIPLVDGKNWHAVLNRNVHYARACGLRDGGPQRRMIPLHRLLMQPPQGMLVDHIDGDGLNCRRSNMRIATTSENTRNQRLSRANKSGRKGVSWARRQGKWNAKISYAGRKRSLGYFDDIEDAAAAYVAASRDLHAEFSNPDGLADAHSKNPPEAEHG